MVADALRWKSGMINFPGAFTQFLLKLKPLVWRRGPLFALLGALLLVLGGKFIYDYISEPSPKITLSTPKENEVVLNDDLYLRGTVTPLGSKVLVNGQDVSLNGDGTFTAILKVQEGENILRVTAEKKGKKAELLRLVNRNLSEEEVRLKQEKEDKEKAEVQSKITSQNQEIAQVQAAYTQRDVKKVRVIGHTIKEDFGVKRVVGEVVNDTDQPAYWVKVTATLFDKDGRTLETKIAFVTSFDKFLKPAEAAPFETQSIDKTFDRYQLEVTWEKQ